MKNSKNKNFAFILIMAIAIVVIMKYKNTPFREVYSDGYGKPLLNYSEILDEKGSSAKDEEVIKNIISNLPANKFYESSSSRVEEEKLEINIHYGDFKEVEVETVDKKVVPVSCLDITSKNITVLFALIPDVDLINVHIGERMIYRYTRNEAKHSYAHGNLDEIIEDDSKLGRFYDLWLG